MGAFQYKVIDSADVLLSGSVQSLVGLLVKLQRPGEPVPDYDVPAVLEVQAVADACGVCQGDRYLAAVPGLDVLGLVKLSAGYALLYSVAVVLVGLEHQHGVAACCLDHFFQGLQLDGVQFVGVPVHIVDGAVCELQQLVG